MKLLVIRLAVWFGFALASAVAIAGPESATIPDADARQIRAVIVAQLQAFADDDADGAFATATPQVREAMGDATRFLALVRGHYPMVYRQAAFSFLASGQADGQVLQIVSLRDPDGGTWLALFALEQQPDKTWRISGCIVTQNDWKAT